MITALLLAVFLGTAAAVILIIYLIDRVNQFRRDWGLFSLPSCGR